MVAAKTTSIGKAYPAKPLYNPRVITIDPDDIMSIGPKAFTEKCIKDLDSAYKKAVGKTFVQQLVNTPKLGVQKKTPYQAKKEKHTALRNIQNHLNQQLADKATISLLAENESVSKYGRERIIQAFQTPTDEQPPPKKRKHSPRFDTVTWDKEKVLQDARNWPVGQKFNWSKFGREDNVSGKNAGQVVKEFCEMSGIDVHSLEGTATPRRRTRAKKKRLPGGE